MTVTLISSMGNDLTVVNAARVSFKRHTNVMRERDVRLIRYLARNGHWSPFAHPQASFRVKAPFFVKNQLQKHQVGCAWNEVSRRYVSEAPEFWWPMVGWRRAASSAKQGSSDEIIQDPMVSAVYDDLMKQADVAYTFMIARGVCPEQARAALPMATYTEWIWTGSLYYFARVCRQRIASDAQRETRDSVLWINGHMARLFPASWPALTTQEKCD